MTGFKQVRRVGLALFGVATLAVLALALGHSTDLGTAHAAGPGPGMSLNVPNALSCTADKCSVNVAQPFLLTISTNPAPSLPLGGFATEVVFDSVGLNWNQRPTCAAEVEVERQDGNAFALCQSFVSTLLSGAAHSVVTEFAVPPVAPLNVTAGSTTVLVEMDFSCKTAGSFEVVLAASPDSAFGAVYADTNANQINVKTVLGPNIDSDPEADQVADTLTINCQEPPPTPTPTNTPVPPTPGPTNTPGGPTDTPAPRPTSTPGGVIVPPEVGSFGDSDGGFNVGLVALVSALLAAAVAGATTFAWRYGRAR